MNTKIKITLTVVVLIITIISCLFLYEEYLSLKNDKLVGVYEKYRGMQFNIETGESIPIYQRDGKIYMKQEIKLNCKNTVVRRHVSEDYGVIVRISSLGLATDNGVNIGDAPNETILCRSVHANGSIAYHLAWQSGDQTYTMDVTSEVTKPRYR